LDEKTTHLEPATVFLEKSTGWSLAPRAADEERASPPG
jgi:hypothetical protein